MKRSPVYPLEPTQADRPPARVVTLQRGPAGLVMVSTVGKLQTAYTVKEIPAHEFGGRGFQLAKLFGGSDGEATGYAVFVDGDATRRADQCHCKGFLRHRHCTHVDGLRQLIAAGELPPQLTPTPVIPVTATKRPSGPPADLPVNPPRYTDRFASEWI